MSKLCISNITKQDFLSRLQAGYEHVSGSKLGRKGQSVVERLACFVLHGDDKPGHNNHLFDQYFAPQEQCSPQEVILLQFEVINSTSHDGEDFVYIEDAFASAHGTEEKAKAELAKVMDRYVESKYKQSGFANTLRDNEYVSQYFHELRLEAESGSDEYFAINDKEEELYALSYQDAVKWIMSTFTVEEVAEGKIFNASLSQYLEVNVSRTPL